MTLPPLLRHQEPKLEIERELGRLVICSTPKSGGEFIWLGVVILFFVGCWFWERSVIFAVFGVFAVASTLYGALKGPQTTSLIVTKFELVSKTPGFFDTGTNVPRMAVKEIGYYAGGEDQPSGLYVKTGWTWSLLIPGIAEPEASRIADLIYEQFPDTPTGDRQPSDIITLGLNR
jgi:hypothetical protein